MLLHQYGRVGNYSADQCFRSICTTAICCLRPSASTKEPDITDMANESNLEMSATTECNMAEDFANTKSTKDSELVLTLFFTCLDHRCLNDSY
jgi:hypothetical protein